MKATNYIVHTGRAPDLVRGRTGATIAGVGSLAGSPLDLSTALTSGAFFIYDATSDTWILSNTADFLTGVSGVYLTTTAGEGNVLYTNTAVGSTITIDLSVANYFDLTLTANCTVSFANPPTSGHGAIFEIILRQGGSGSYTVTWPAAVKWQSATGTNTGSAPTLFTAVGALDVITLTTLDGGVTYGASHESGLGTLTSVALTAPAEFSVAGSPITSSGTLAVTKANQNPNLVWAGPTSGSAAAPTFRALVAADLPSGVGSDHEHVMDCLFSGDGSTTAWTLPAAPFDQYSVAAYVAGTLTEVTLSGADWTTATFGSAPTSGTNNIRFDIVAAVLP